MARVDVVYPLGSGSSWRDNEELRYSLRALEANFTDLGQVIVVGHKPSWLSRAALHIEAGDPLTGNKDGNMIAKLLAAVAHTRSEWIVRCSDDELFLKPSCLHEMRALFWGDLRRVRGVRRSLWHRRLRNTASYLIAQGKPSRFFDCHAPVPMHAQRFADLVGPTPFREGCGMSVDSLYFNLDNRVPRRAATRQVARLQGSNWAQARLRGRLRTAQFLNYDDRSLTDTVKNYLTTTFPEPSKYELS